MAFMEIGKVNDNSGKKYTMADLNITEGSPAASILNRIDKSDGNVDGYLTENQYEEYMSEIAKFKDNLPKKETNEQTEKNDKNQGKSLIKFGLSLLYFVTHGFKLPPADKYNDDQNVKKHSDPKLVELEKQVKEKFGEK